MKHKKLSIFISLILRHKPEVINERLDDQGFIKVNKLISGINNSGKIIDMEILEEIVNTDSKNRYSFSSDKKKIRANQGHSIPVSLGLKEKIPPARLYHGTSADAVDKILLTGINKMKRQYVHLSSDIGTAFEVGKRHGNPVVLEIDAQKMEKAGYKFFLSENGVWLTSWVKYIFITDIKEK